MQFSPLTRKAILDESNPENVIEANKGAFFFRDGDSSFYVIDNNSWKKLEISPKVFLINYQNNIWYNSIKETDISFSKQNEIWIKTGSGKNSIGWTFYSNKRFKPTNI